MDTSGLIASLRQAVSAAPEDVVLRLHLAELLLDSGDTDGAIAEASNALRQDPTSVAARALMMRTLSPPPALPADTPGTDATVAPATDPTAPSTTEPPATEPPAIEPAAPPAAPAGNAPPVPPDPPSAGDTPGGFDWLAAEEELGDIVAPRLVDDADDATDEPAFSVERVTVRLADVGGMEKVKQRLEIAFLAPLRNQEMSRLFGKSLRGGLLLYGPPGCGKTFIARAVAGEMGASFLSVGISDVLDMFIGNAERNLHDLFLQARRKAPCVLFLDEIDALGQRRSRTFNTGMRTTVNQLLTELDDVHAGNDGVFVLAATNQPWDVDPALRRPGRFDRTVLVLPPDPAARQAILRYHLRALLDSMRSGAVRMITMADLEAALAEVRPSTGPWLDAARNVVLFANEGGAYDELLEYLKERRLL